MNIMEMVRTKPQLSIISSLLEASEDAHPLTSRQKTFTLFAPANSAFASFSSEAMYRLRQPEGEKILHRLVNTHIVHGNVTRQDLLRMTSVKTALGDAIHITHSPKLQLKDCAFLQSDIVTDNGTLHIINTIILWKHLSVRLQNSKNNVQPWVAVS